MHCVTASYLAAYRIDSDGVEWCSHPSMLSLDSAATLAESTASTCFLVLSRETSLSKQLVQPRLVVLLPSCPLYKSLFFLFEMRTVLRTPFSRRQWPAPQRHGPPSLESSGLLSWLCGQNHSALPSSIHSSTLSFARLESQEAMTPKLATTPASSYVPFSSSSLILLLNREGPRSQHSTSEKPSPSSSGLVSLIATAVVLSSCSASLVSHSQYSPSARLPLSTFSSSAGFFRGVSTGLWGSLRRY